MYEINNYTRIIRERGKKTRKKIDLSEGQCALEKILMSIITLTGKKKEKIYCSPKKITKIVIYHIVAITATKQINILLSCLKIYAR